MKKTDIIKPQAIASAIAQSGVKDAIPNAATGTNYCSVAEGFPEVTMKDILTEGGIPPRGQGANGLFYLSTDQRFYLQNGGIITFDADVSTAIGGYPKDAILDYIVDGVEHKVISLIDDNTYNFINNPSYIDGTYWAFVESGTTDRKLAYGILEAPNGVVDVTTTTITAKTGLKICCPNGRNADGTLKNYIYTLPEDLSYTKNWGNSTSIIWLTSVDGGENWYVGLRNLSNQYFEQTTQPTLPDGANGTWFNPETNLCKDTDDNWATSVNKLYCPLGIAITESGSPNGVITKFIQFNTVKLLSLYDDLTSFDKPATSGTTLSYNTEYRIPENGYIDIDTSISVRTTTSTTISVLAVKGTIDGTQAYYHYAALTGAQQKGIKLEKHQRLRVYKGQKFKLFTDTSSGDFTLNSTSAVYYTMANERYNVITPS